MGGLGGGWDVNVRLDVLTCPLLLFMCLVSVTLRMLSWGGLGGLGGGWDVNVRSTPNVLLAHFSKQQSKFAEEMKKKDRCETDDSPKKK